jgi:hypothetical protein
MRALVIASLVLLWSDHAALAGRGGGRGGGGGGARMVIRSPPPPRVVVHHPAPPVRVPPARVQPGVRVVQGGRPRYFDADRRPPLLVENYGRRPGYYWISGAWQWDGLEWVWYPGRYEIDPNYAPSRGYYNGRY